MSIPKHLIDKEKVKVKKANQEGGSQETQTEINENKQVVLSEREQKQQNREMAENVQGWVQELRSKKEAEEESGRSMLRR
jgi:hypothetical protein